MTNARIAAEMAEVKPEQSDGGISRNRERRKKRLALLAYHELGPSPVEARVFRPGDGDG